MDIYELIGFIIGDGNIYYNTSKRVYRLELVGNVNEDYDYFDEIYKFLIKETGRKPLKFIRKEKDSISLRIQFNHKVFVDRLIALGLPKGKKTFTIQIPDNLLRRDILISIVKGIFEADGCLYFSHSKKGEYPSYPRLEIRSSSPVLVSQIKSFLKSEGFSVYVKKPSSNKTFSILLSGEKMLNLWINTIGLTSLKNQTKYNFWKTKGFYIPHTALKQRLDICGGGTAATAVDFSKE